VGDVREGRFVGMSADGRAVVVEVAGEHVRVPADDNLRRAITGDGQMPIPLESHVTPREVQHRIRCGETAAEIAAAAGVAVELIARFEGPVLDERRWHAERLRRTEVDGVRVEDRVQAVAARDGDDPAIEWDAWLGDDAGWRVRAAFGDGRSSTWAWDPRTQRIRAQDDLARVILSGDVFADDLDAVLRPLSSVRKPSRLEAVPAPTDDEPTLDEADETAADDDTDAVTVEEEPPAQEAVRSKRRTSVPSWDDIMLGTVRRRPSDDA